MASEKGCTRSHTGRWENEFLLRASCRPIVESQPRSPSLATIYTDKNTQMDFRKSFSKPFKKLKGKLPGGSRKLDGRSGSEDSRSGRELDDVEGGKASHRSSYLRSEVNVVGAVESGPSREGINIDGKKATLVDANPPTSAPLILHIGEADGM